MLICFMDNHYFEKLSSGTVSEVLFKNVTFPFEWCIFFKVQCIIIDFSPTENYVAFPVGNKGVFSLYFTLAVMP